MDNEVKIFPLNFWSYIMK